MSKRSVFIDNLMKQLLHSRLLDMRLVKFNSALRASLAIYHLISSTRSWNNFLTIKKCDRTFLKHFLRSKKLNNNRRRFDVTVTVRHYLVENV